MYQIAALLKGLVPRKFGYFLGLQSDNHITPHRLRSCLHSTWVISAKGWYKKVKGLKNTSICPWSRGHLANRIIQLLEFELCQHFALDRNTTKSWNVRWTMSTARANWQSLTPSISGSRFPSGTMKATTMTAIPALMTTQSATLIHTKRPTKNLDRSRGAKTETLLLF